VSHPPHVARLLSALDTLDDAAAANIERASEIRRRVSHLRDRIEEGEPVGQVVADEERPLVVELVTENMQALESWGSILRRTEAQALRAEGMTQQEIADLFGVTRQRISALLASG
jgi:predicted XRE-type DNA-binding protein